MTMDNKENVKAKKAMDARVMTALIRREVHRRDDAKKKIDAAVDACNLISAEYDGRARRPISWRREMLRGETVRALGALGTVYVGYGNKKMPPARKFRIEDGECYAYKKMKPEEAPEDILRSRGDEILSNVKDKGVSAAFGQFLAYVDRNKKRFAGNDPGYVSRVSEPTHDFSPRTVWITDYDGVEARTKVSQAAIDLDYNSYDHTYEAMLELYDTDNDRMYRGRITEFMVAQLKPELDALLALRERMADKNLKFIRGLHHEADETLGPWLALRAL
jgi:hypothetical protein